MIWAFFMGRKTPLRGAREGTRLTDGALRPLPLVDPGSQRGEKEEMGGSAQRGGPGAEQLRWTGACAFVADSPTTAERGSFGG
mmetsp:Transcript_58631/g.126845  ORF Transcript_58631/g.126845 Transcript_58631/m.126845 type:complete len:83 (-) Transcript_58631:614-862(-)